MKLTMLIGALLLVTPCAAQVMQTADGPVNAYVLDIDCGADGNGSISGAVDGAPSYQFMCGDDAYHIIMYPIGPRSHSGPPPKNAVEAMWHDKAPYCPVTDYEIQYFIYKGDDGKNVFHPWCVLAQ